MNQDLIHLIFAEFCETRTHLDSLLSEVELTQKKRVAMTLGAFLRRPYALADYFKIDLGDAAEFWDLSFIKIRKHPGVHELLEQIWAHHRRFDELPKEGGIEDFPPAMIAEWTRDWGEEAARSFARNLSQDPLTTIRLHRRAREAEDQLLAEFAKVDLPKMRKGYYSTFARVFKGFARVRKNPLFQAGWYEIQDEGSQVMSMASIFPAETARLLSSEPMQGRHKFDAIDFDGALKKLPTLTVIDACAGGGGKTLALADFLEGKGRLFAYDIYENKINALKKRAERAQERNIKASVVNPEVLPQFYASADRVLVDAPCSGLGVLRRNPDIKWNRVPMTLSPVEQVPIEDLQRKIVTDYLPLVKPGGFFTYGVCTFTKSETVDQLNWISENHPEYQLVASGFVGPFETDGFFMATFQRK